MKELFKIYKVDVAEALRIEQTDNTAHQHDFEELIIGLKGKLNHFIDYKETNYPAPFISFVTKGKFHRVKPEIVDNECDFWVIRFKSEFIPEITFQFYNYYHDRANFTLKSSDRLDRIDTLCRLIQQETTCEYSDLSIVKDLLSALFSMIEYERRINQPTDLNTIDNQNTTFRNFLSILEENFRRAEGVSFYAEKLFMSNKTLNTITQNILHLSVSEIIETRKLIEAKNLLFTTSKSISEIGYELGYTDKAYFTSVFKKKSGTTPSEFREEMKNSIS